MDFMDLGWIFHGIHGFRLDFHGSGLDFLRISWIWGGFSMEFMDLDWISMDLAWIFYGFHGYRVDFHASGLDFLRISWI